LPYHFAPSAVLVVAGSSLAHSGQLALGVADLAMEPDLDLDGCWVMDVVGNWNWGSPMMMMVVVDFVDVVIRDVDLDWSWQMTAILMVIHLTEHFVACVLWTILAAFVNLNLEGVVAVSWNSVQHLIQHWRACH
jgi:hypothetical protein